MLNLFQHPKKIPKQVRDDKRLRKTCMNTDTRHFRLKGQSLVEVVVAFGVVIVIVTALLSSTLVSIKAARIGKMRTQAIKYAQEGIELARSLRDTNEWTIFQAYAGGVPEGYTLTYCVDRMLSWPVSSGACSVPNIDTIYTRNVTLTWDDINAQMAVKSSVTWLEGSITKTSEFTTTLTEWK